MNFLRKLFLLTSLIVISTQVGFSLEDEKKIQISPTGDTVLIQSIPDAEITTNIEDTYEKIKKIEARLPPGKDLQKFDTIYDKAYKGLDSAQAVVTTSKEYFSIRDIDDVLKEWNNYSNLLNDWRDKINERIKTLEQDQFEVSVLKDRWSLTYKNARESGVPPSVLTSVSNLSETLSGLQKEVKLKQTEALRKQNNITKLRLMVDESISFLTERRKLLQSDYFIQDSPRLWKAYDSTTNINVVKKQISTSLDNTSRSFVMFHEANRGKIIIHLLIFLLLWVSFYFLHKQVLNVDEKDDKFDLDRARSVISHYGISAAIISLFISLWLYSSIVTSVNDLIQLSYLVIALFFLPNVVDKRLRIILFALLGLFFINQIQDLLPGKMFLTRLIMIVESFVAGWILYKILSPKYFISRQLKEYGWSILLKLVPVFYLFIIVSLVSNFLGYVNLGVLLNSATTNSLFNLNILILAIMVTNRTLAVLLRTSFMMSSNIIKNDLHIIEKRVTKGIQIIGVLIWLKTILEILGLYLFITEWFTNSLEASWQIGNSTIAVDGIINFILVIAGTYFISKGLRILLKKEVYPRVKLPRGVPGSISMLSSYVIAGYGLFIALGAAGIDLSNFGLVAGALGVGIGFGLQGIVANFIAGLVLAFERPIQVGDTIEMGTMMGDVTQIGVRACTIRTYDGSEVIVPNSSIITNDVINWTLSDRRKRRDIVVTVAYNSDPEVVLTLIKKVAEDHPDVLKIPAPWALFDGFGDNSLNFRIRIWTIMDTGMTTKSKVTVAIYSALRNAGIEIPFPQRDLHIKSVDPSLQQIVKGDKSDTKKSISGVSKSAEGGKSTEGRKSKQTE